MLNYEKLMTYPFPDTVGTNSPRDSMLYAVGVGLGADPVDEKQLRFLFERRPDFAALPTMATVIAAPHAWSRKAQVGQGTSVHSGGTVRIVKHVPIEGNFVTKMTIGEVLDKGPGKAALVTTHRKTYNADTNELMFEVDATSMLRGDGGFGGKSQPDTPDPAMPTRAPDAVEDLPTLRQAALIYRLSGDYNPLHADPATAKKQGFPRPILHGLGTFGHAGHAILKVLCDYDPTKMKSIGARFARPVFPGDTLRVKMWVDGSNVLYQVTVPTRNDDVVLDFGTAEIG